MGNKLETQEDLEFFFDCVFPPFDQDDLEGMLEVTRHLQVINPTDHLNIERLRQAIERIKDADYRDMFRRKSTMTLAGLGTWNEALAMAYQVEVLIERLDTLLLLTTKLFEANKSSEALSILGQVEKMAYEARAEDIRQWQRARVLHEIGENLFRAGYKQKALEVWKKAVRIFQSGQIGEDENIALQEIVRGLASAGYLDLAEQAANLIGLPARKEIALETIAKARKEH
jgi:tetratricopeptide (TPR) repeat protein